MKLIEALEILRRPTAGASNCRIFLACGFTPLHLQTFLGAQLLVRVPKKKPVITTGLFDDLAGSLERFDPAATDALAVVLEWGDIDPRLSVRTLGGWRPSQMTAILESATESAARLRNGVARASRRVPTVVSLPTLPLPPMFSTRSVEGNSAETRLGQIVASFAASLSELPGVRLVNAQFLNEASPPAGRYDVKGHLASGFPYALQHASAVAEVLASLIHAQPPKKGLITDLDDTVWAGILGDDGVDGISWHLDRHTQMHGIYQQVLASLAGAGVLIGVASKNDPAMVERAFERTDLLLSKGDIFPIEAHWSPKSESVQRILKTWNIGADAVVFVDDSPMEVAEVKAAFPEMECISFPKADDRGIWELLRRLRDLFGKSVLTEEDSLRTSSIREAGAWRDLGQSAGKSADEFLQSAEAHIVFDFNPGSGETRAFELVNKTNQFNLNGTRLSEAEWRNFLADPAAFMLVASYRDKFGALGKIAVMMGTAQGRKVNVSSWVMSCRAFSRRIEHQCLQYLFETTGADEITFDYQATPRNGPLQEFLAALLGSQPSPGTVLTRNHFLANVPALFHRVEVIAHV